MLPLKSVRMSVDMAMDKNDKLSEAIQKWFKVHTAMNDDQLCFMLEELIEEESIIERLWNKEKHDDVKAILAKWMAFDIYPEKEKVWDELDSRWRRNDGAADARHEYAGSASQWPGMWKSITGLAIRNSPGNSLEFTVEKTRNLVHYDNSGEELTKVESCLADAEATFANSNDPGTIYRKGTILQYGSKHVKAANEFQRLIKIDKNATGAMDSIAYSYYRLKRYDEGLAWSKKYLTANPGSVKALLRYACMVAAKKRYAEGMEICERILCKEEYNAGALLTKAACLSGMGKDNEAVKTLKRILEKDPNDSACYDMLGAIAFKERDYRTAAECCDRYVRLEPGDFEGHCHKALVGQLDRESEIPDDEVIKLYEKSLEINPEHAESWNGIGSILSKKGAYKEAVFYLEKSLELKPDLGMVLSGLGVARTFLGDCDGAMSCLDKVLQANPGHGYALFCKSAVHAMKGSIQECLDCLEGAIALDPEFRKMAKDRSGVLFGNVAGTQEFRKLTGRGARMLGFWEGALRQLPRRKN